MRAQLTRQPGDDKQTLGELKVIDDNDGYRDVTGSQNTLSKLLAILPEEFELTVE